MAKVWRCLGWLLAGIVLVGSSIHHADHRSGSVPARRAHAGGLRSDGPLTLQWPWSFIGPALLVVAGTRLRIGFPSGSYDGSARDASYR
jgi:hypothetical protein